MAIQTPTPYQRGTPSVLPGGDQQYLDNELKKLEGVIRDLIAIIEALRIKVGL